MHQATLKRAVQLTPERLSGRLRGGTLTVKPSQGKLKVYASTDFLAISSPKVAHLFPSWSKKA
jgi:hypothetical protein